MGAGGWRATAIAATAVLAVACSSTASGPAAPPAARTSPTSATTTPGAPALPTRRYAVSFRTETFVDSSRPTPANRGVPKAPSRTLVTLILAPTDGPPGADAAPGAPIAHHGGPFPLIVFGHGFTGFAGAYEGLLESWAAAGYVVAAPNFPLTNLNAPGRPNVTDYVSQPGDVSFVISSMLAESNRPNGPLSGGVDPHRIAVAGHSLGAITVIGLLNSCCRDARIDAAVVLSGAELPFSGSRFAGGPAVPMLFVHGTHDGVVKYDFGQKAYADAPSPKFFLSLEGADHVGPYIGGPTAHPANTAVAEVSIDFLDRFLRDDATAAARMLQDGNVPGIASLRSS